MRILWSIILFVVVLDYVLSIRWLSLQHSTLHWNLTSNVGRGIRSGIRSPCGLARRRYGFVKLQAKLCRNWMEAMPHVQKAANLAVQTCQNIFQYRRWNCSSIVTAPYLTPDLTRATREQAYVYAISSAALTYQMARACSSGSLYHCTCANHPNEPPTDNFQWGGCSDNINWGIYFTKRFIDNVEKFNVNKTIQKLRRDNRNHQQRQDNNNHLLHNHIAMVNLHNNRIGRRIIVESLQTQCKCHGVSGSCSIRTCWKGLPSMIEIGKRLLQRYTNAIELKKIDNEWTHKKKTQKQLMYIAKSPDYCTRDLKLGSFGTVGRRCNVTTTATNSCRQLCCGRGYRTVVEEKIERCHCKYYNCCYVKCSICRSMTQIYECS